MRSEFEKLPEIARNGKPRIVYGYGVSDIQTGENGEHSREYKTWRSMLRRCYAKNRSNISDNYLECSVSDDFKVFSNFKNWCVEQKGFGNIGWELDKDLIVKGNTVYSKETCCFLPREINSVLITQKKRRGSLPIGVYFNKKTGAYMGRVNVKCKMKNLGTRKTINEAFLLYKNEKELIIKMLAEKYKGVISDKAYHSLMNYKVEITD